MSETQPWKFFALQRLNFQFLKLNFQFLEGNFKMSEPCVIQNAYPYIDAAEVFNDKRPSKEEYYSSIVNLCKPLREVCKAPVLKFGTPQAPMLPSSQNLRNKKVH